MTQKEFDALPLLLKPEQAMEALGCNEDTLRILREGTPGIAIRLPGMKHHRYLKANIALLAKVEYK